MRLKKEEAKSLSPDGSPCTETTRGLLGRTRIFAHKISPVGKETDRRWEQGEDPSMLEPSIHRFETPRSAVVGDASERKRWAAIGVRRLIRESSLAQETVYKILNGEPVRRYILSGFRQAVDKTTL
jgi:hypothetical protein